MPPIALQISRGVKAVVADVVGGRTVAVGAGDKDQAAIGIKTVDVGLGARARDTGTVEFVKVLLAQRGSAPGLAIDR